MSKVAFLTIPAHGHVNPNLPILSVLHSLNEDVHVYSTIEFKEKISTTGNKFCDYFEFLDYKPLVIPNNLVQFAPKLLEISIKILPGLIQKFQKEKYDYLIFDAICPWGKILEKIFQIPSISLFPIFIFKYFQNKIPEMNYILFSTLRYPISVLRIFYLKNKLLKTYKLKNYSVQEIFANEGMLNLVFTIRNIHPKTKQLPCHYQFVGPMIRDDKTKNNSKIKKQEKLIYISLGTLFNFRLDFYKACIHAFKNSNYDVIISVGTSLEFMSGWVIPKNIKIERHVDQLTLLTQTDLFISHGGMNSVHESLSAGVPLLLFPQMFEQRIVAKMVENLGAGEIFNKKLTGKNIKNLAEKLLNDQNYKMNAKNIQNEFLKIHTQELLKEIIIRFKYKLQTK